MQRDFAPNRAEKIKSADLPMFVVDLDSDSFDEVIYSCSYNESQYIHLIRWENGKPIIETLSGDGA